MRSLFFSRTTLVWFGLVAATALSWEMGHGLGFTNPRHAGVAILVVAFVKVRFVILDFMEIRHAPLFMRLVAEAWFVVACTTLVVLFLGAPEGGLM
jgi:hypothetical protein